MQKHAERTDKRPPITGGRGSGQGNQSNQSGSNHANNNNNTNNNNNNIVMNATIPPAVPQDHPYWPKVSPDSAATIPNEIISHHQQHQQQQHHHEFQLVNSHELQHHQRDESIEDLRQNGHLNSQPLAIPPSSTPNGYDGQAKLSSNSAFTPINSMPPHLNIQHHQLSQRPSYIYDAISFQNKNVAQNSGNGFPNQLISLHQIRNYAHQPGTGLMAGDHIIGVTVGKDKV
jgi:zinc finger protein 362/384